jgi:hypothetical protein
MEPTIAGGLKTALDAAVKGTPHLFGGITLACAVVVFGHKADVEYIRDIPSVWMPPATIIGLGSAALFLTLILGRIVTWLWQRAASRSKERLELLALHIDQQASYWNQAVQSDGSVLTTVYLSILAHNPSGSMVEILEARIRWPFWWGQGRQGYPQPSVTDRVAAQEHGPLRGVAPRATRRVAAMLIFQGRRGPRKSKRLLVSFSLRDQQGRDHGKWGFVDNPTR